MSLTCGREEAPQAGDTVGEGGYRNGGESRRKRGE